MSEILQLDYYYGIEAEQFSFHCECVKKSL